MKEIALFPLSSVLVPHGFMALQIFEQRYIDLVADCMRNDCGFGVIWLRQGSEISKQGIDTVDVGDYGTYARIVDWDQLANGLLGITVQGCERVHVDGVWRENNGLVKADVQCEPLLLPVPMLDAWQSLAVVLKGLEMHPHVQRMNLNIDYSNAWEVTYSLIQLLPLEESVKYELLGIASIEQLVEALDVLLNQISGEE
tara:strand:- start:254 stop:850 length:597 start_codon:yes stop_codon:yes gene_type:complete